MKCAVCDAQRLLLSCAVSEFGAAGVLPRSGADCCLQQPAEGELHSTKGVPRMGLLTVRCVLRCQSESRVAELEAAKDQMEQDLFNSQQALQALQQSERKVATHKRRPFWSVYVSGRRPFLVCVPCTSLWSSSLTCDVSLPNPADCSV